jgi:nitrite reductase (NADH) small subunit
VSITDRAVTWVPVCRAGDLTPDRGVAVLVDGRPVAVFLLAATPAAPATLYAVDHLDPATGVAVMARGLVGSAGDRPYVASPLHKQRYDLATGACLDDDSVHLDTWPVRLVGEVVEVGRDASREVSDLGTG